MYQVGDLIMYGNYGVCKVETVGKPDIVGIDKSKLYYTLSSLYHNEKVYTPIDTNVFMRPVITNAEAQQLISRIPLISESVYNNHSLRLVEDYYKELLQTHDCYDLLKLIKTVYAKKKLAMEQGKKPGQIDERFMRIAEDLLHGEFAVALGISKGSVKSYIEEKVRELENIDVTTIARGEIYEFS
jgi:Transcriptional regulators, similar to M. xanthus CarD